MRSLATPTGLPLLWISLVNLCVPAEVNVIEPVIATIFLIYDDVFDAVVVQVGKYRNGLGFAIIEGDVGVYPWNLKLPWLMNSTNCGC